MHESLPPYEEVIIIDSGDLPRGFMGDASDTVPLPSLETKGRIELHGVNRYRLPAIAEVINDSSATTKEAVLDAIPKALEIDV